VEVEPVRWLAGHLGWFTEYWIGRNTMRSLGTRCGDGPTRLASIEPQADAWWNPALAPRAARWRLDLPDMPNVRAYLLDTLEGTLDLLEKAPDEDDALYFFRLALFHEDLRGEQWIRMAQTLGLHLQLDTPGGAAARDAVLVPPTRWSLGSPAGGFAFDNEQPAQALDVPEFEIDALPVSWAQYVEFVDDGGYDREDLWHPKGWDWLQRKAGGEGRRGPRYVEQIGVASGAVMQTRFGRPSRMAGSQTAMHVTWWEADAWARWAGRRLPTEIEWEIAAHTAARRGFQWGNAWEWTATTFKPYAQDGSFVAGPWTTYSQPWFGRAKVVRGASFATRARMKHPKFRGFALPDRDDGFVGFRSCAM
jgi:iron(II)-dependent oxidoreductase